MSLIDDTCDNCGGRFDPMGDPLLTKHPEVGPYAVFCATCETCVPPAQHPAAPETETDANGLTEAERQVPMAVAGVRFPEVSRAVERIVAERVRVVEGERDALRFDRDAAVASWRSACGRADLHLARAESAEAAHEAEKAAHERLRADRDEAWRVAAQRRSEARRYYVAWQVARMRAQSLRSLLAGGGDR